MSDRNLDFGEGPVDEALSNYIGIRCYRNKEWGSINFAIDSNTNKMVAIKSYNLPIHSESEYHTERDILWKTKEDPHEYVIKLLNVIESDTYSHIILENCNLSLVEHMKYIHKHLLMTLKSVWEKRTGRCVEIMFQHHQTVARITREIILGVAYLHDKGICHWDLSMENILIHYDSHIRLIDFGLSNIYEGQRWPKDHRRVGKTLYISHEAYVGRKVDPRDNDMWSIGVILWIMLVWKYPWEIPHPSDFRFKMIFTQGKKGIRKCLKMVSKKYVDYQKPRFQMLKEQVDFLARIFRNEKHRLTIGQAKKHSLFNDSKPFEPIISPKRRTEVPCEKIEEHIHRSRYDTEPWKVDKVWWKLEEEERKTLVKYLLTKDKQYWLKKQDVTIFDERIVAKVMKHFKLNKDQVTSIISFLWFFVDKAHHQHYHEHPFFCSRSLSSSSRSCMSELKTSPSSGLSNAMYENRNHYSHDTLGASLLDEKIEPSGSRCSLGSIILESKEPSDESMHQFTKGVRRLD